MVTTFKNILTYYQNELIVTNVTINNKIIIAIGKQQLGKVITFNQNYLLTTNFIDLHAHFRQPGFKKKETLKTGSKAALYGGYQLVCLMANTNPVLDNKKIITKLIKKSMKMPIKIKFFSAITKNLQGQELVSYQTLNNYVVGFSDDGNYLSNHNLLTTILQFANKNNKLIALHVDDKTNLQEQVILHQDAAQKFNLSGVDDNFESKNLIKDLQIVTSSDLPYHLCHVSTKTSIEALIKAKKVNQKITCEVTPHHLIFHNKHIIENNSNYKMNPPISSEESNQALIAAYNKGIIDIIATDHAPHEQKKKKDLKNSAVGIIGLQTAFASLYTHMVLTNKIPLVKILAGLTNGAKLINYANYKLEINNNANFVIIDLLKKQIVTKEFLQSKSKNTPFLQKELIGWPIINVIDGKIFYLNCKEKKQWPY